MWTAVWIFQLANWVGQDYFAPQGLAYLLHLTVIAMVLRHFVRPGSAGRLRDRTALDPGRRRRAAAHGTRSARSAWWSSPR
ncbi:hypothetical protein GCM10023238_21380 [Streptomyces heliomycini]